MEDFIQKPKAFQDNFITSLMIVDGIDFFAHKGQNMQDSILN